MKKVLMALAVILTVAGQGMADEDAGLVFNPKFGIFKRDANTRGTVRVNAGFDMLIKGSMLDFGVGGFYQIPSQEYFVSFIPVYLVFNLHGDKATILPYLTGSVGYSFITINNVYDFGYVGRDMDGNIVNTFESSVVSKHGDYYLGAGAGLKIFDIIQLEFVYYRCKGFIEGHLTSSLGIIKYDSVQYEETYKITLGVLF